jgi:hypothetical protein
MLKSLDDFCTIFKTIFSHKDLPNVDVDDLFFLIESGANVSAKCVDVIN